MRKTLSGFVMQRICHWPSSCSQQSALQALSEFDGDANERREGCAAWLLRQRGRGGNGLILACEMLARCSSPNTDSLRWVYGWRTPYSVVLCTNRLIRSAPTPNGLTQHYCSVVVW